MIKNLLCSAAALGLMSQVAVANGVIINGVPHQGGNVINVPYGGSAHNCCAPTPATTYTSAPVVNYEAAPAVYQPAPISYETAPVSYEATPIVSPVTYEAAPMATEELIYIDEPTTAAPIVTTPVVTTPYVETPTVVASPAPASYAAPKAKARGWGSRVYVGARGGWSALRDTDFSLRGGNVKNEYDDAGYNVSAVVGWGAKIQNSIGYRLEAELGYQTADIDSHSVGGRTFGSQAFGETNTLYGFANAYIDVPIVNRLNGVIGGGIGAGKVEFDAHGIDVAGVGRVMDDEDTVFGYHLDAGLSYDVTDQLALEAMYRYTSFVDVELTALDGAKSETDVDSHNVVLGARYGF